MPVKSGIYCIENIYNGKLYIGSSFNVHQRLSAHASLLRRGKSHNKHLQAAYDKYGKDAFVSYIIEICEPEKVKEREQFWIGNTSCLSGYNKSNTVVDNSGWKHSEQYINRLSKERMGAGNPLYGKKMSEAEIEVVRKNSTGRTHSKTAIEKMKAQRKKNRGNYLGSKCGKAILTEEKVYEIKVKLAKKIPQATIAREYNVHPATIGSIHNKRRWNHVQLKTA